jgi:hypothetical protein
MEKADSPLMTKINNEIVSNFEKRFKAFFTIANKLKIADDEAAGPIKEAAALPGINGDYEVLLAIVFQNLIQPKNA